MKPNRLSILLMLLIVASHLSAFFLVTNLCIALLALNSIFQKEILRKVSFLINDITFWISIVPFLIYFLSLLNSNNSVFGWKEIETQVSLIVLPVIFGLLRINNTAIISIIKWSILLIGVFPIIGFIHQIGIVNQTSDSGYFYNDNLVSLFDKQAVYFAFFINTAILFLIYLIENKLISSTIERIIASICFTSMIGAQYLLASRTSLVITAIIISLYIGYIAVKRLTQKQGTLLVIASIVTLFSLLMVFPKALIRFKSITNVEFQFDNPNPINHFNGEIKKENWNGFNTRLAIWQCSWELIQESPWIGYGVGDVQDKLYEKYSEKNFKLAMQSNYNTHNQFIDIWLTAGVLGLLAFITFFIYFMHFAYRQNNWVLLAFIITFAISCLTENILNRSQGLIFFAFFFSILIFSTPKVKKLTSNFIK